MSAVEKLEVIEQVGMLKLKGKSDTQIAKQLKLKRTNVSTLFSEFQRLIVKESTEGSLAQQLEDLLFESNQSMKLVLDELWENYHEAKTNGDDRLAVDVLKEIRTLTSQRHKMVASSGFKDEEMAAEMEETAYRQEVLVGLLKQLKESHPETAQIIAEGLSKIQDDVELIAIERGGE